MERSGQKKQRTRTKKKKQNKATTDKDQGKADRFHFDTDSSLDG